MSLSKKTPPTKTLVVEQAPPEVPVRFSGTCEPLCDVDVNDLVKWITGAFKPEEWHKNADQPYVLGDQNWHNFGKKTDAVVAEILKRFPGAKDTGRTLSAVHPGDYVPPHRDTLWLNWVTRIHVPLVTNPGAFLTVKDVKYHLDVGKAYQVNIGVPHSITNGGEASRVHFMFDITFDQ